MTAEPIIPPALVEAAVAAERTRPLTVADLLSAGIPQDDLIGWRVASVDAEGYVGEIACWDGGRLVLTITAEIGPRRNREVSFDETLSPNDAVLDDQAAGARWIADAEDDREHDARLRRESQERWGCAL